MGKDLRGKELGEGIYQQTNYRTTTIYQTRITLYNMLEFAKENDVILRNPCKRSVKSDMGKPFAVWCIEGGMSSYNKEYSEELGLSEETIEQLADKDFYEFSDTLYHYVEGLHGMTEEMKEQFHGLDIKGYFIWQLQMFVQKFIQNEIKKLGLDITTE